MRYADRVKGMKASEIRELLKITEHPEMISFAGGMPSPDSFPVNEIKKIVVKVLGKHGKQALQYGTTEGLESLREAIAKRMSKSGVKCSKDGILVASGAEQLIDLIGKIFINPGDYVVLENPTFLGAIVSFNAYQPRYIPIPVDENGMVTTVLEETLKKYGKSKLPKFIYTVPTFHNPCGVTLSLERRKHLLRLAEKYKIPIVEDDAYSELRYSGRPLPSLKSLDNKGIVIHLRTFSKILAPGLRLGWAVADKKILRKIIIAKQGTDSCTNTLSQYIADEYLRSGLANKQIPKIRKMYKRKRNIMLKAMEKYFPEHTKWTRPEGGLFIWVTLPESINTKKIQKKALKEKVAFVQGSAFFVKNKKYNTMRLNFSNTDDRKIREGIRRLAKIIEKEC